MRFRRGRRRMGRGRRSFARRRFKPRIRRGIRVGYRM